MCDKCLSVGMSSSDFGYNLRPGLGCRTGGFECGKYPSWEDFEKKGTHSWCGGNVIEITSPEELEEVCSVDL